MSIHKKNRSNLLFFLIGLFTLWSCDPCENCNAVDFEPNVKGQFINQTQLVNIADSLTVFSAIDSSLTKNIDSLRVLGDSLDIIVDSIASGGDLTQEKMNLESLIEARRADSSFFSERNIGSDSLIRLLNTEKDLIESGSVLLDEIEIVTSGFVLTSVDSATLWNFPLDFTETPTTFNFSIEGNDDPYTISFSYDIIREVDVERTVLPRAENIELISHNFDSVDICQENCIDGQATFIFYF